MNEDDGDIVKDFKRSASRHIAFARRISFEILISDSPEGHNEQEFKRYFVTRNVIRSLPSFSRLHSSKLDSASVTPHSHGRPALKFFQVLACYFPDDPVATSLPRREINSPSNDKRDNGRARSRCCPPRNYLISASARARESSPLFHRSLHLCLSVLRPSLATFFSPPVSFLSPSPRGKSVSPARREIYGPYVAPPKCRSS